MPRMLRILATGDLHARHDLMAWVLDRASDVDLVCLTGDLLLDGRLDQAPAVQAWLERFPTPVVVATGNHDLLDGHDDTWLHEVQNTNVHVDTVTTVAGVAVGAIPYLGADLERYARCDVLVVHVPPTGTRTARDTTADWGDQALRDALDEGILAPRYLLCGHVERPLAREDVVGHTVVVNHGGASPHEPGFCIITVRP